ncbi:hypothetical protein P7C70_g5932, partial [Phenoliferia sp. Uapishka_3]
MAQTTPKLAFQLNPNLIDTNPPPIPLAASWASLYTPTPSHPLINLAQGVPGAPPPPDFQKRLGEAAADASTTTYGDLRGDEALREGLARDVNAVYETDVQAEEITITAGCNLAFYATMVSLAKAGDEIIVPTPWYFNNEVRPSQISPPVSPLTPHPLQMTLHQLGIHPIPLPCPPPAFLPSPTLCASLITSRTRAIILVSPNNPTGAIYPPELITEFGILAREKGVALVVDETYREFLPAVGQKPHGLFSAKGEEEDWRGYLIQLFSFSKSYAIPGHRLGSIIASLPIQLQIHKTMDCLQICPARPAQVAVAWAIDGTRPWREGVTKELVERARVFRDGMEEAEGWEVMTGGGYFAYVKHPFIGVSSEKVAASLAEKVGVVVLPGTFFGPKFELIDDDRYLRFSIANVGQETLKMVPERLRRMVEIGVKP